MVRPKKFHPHTPRWRAEDRRRRAAMQALGLVGHNAPIIHLNTPDLAGGRETRQEAAVQTSKVLRRDPPNNKHNSSCFRGLYGIHGGGRAGV